MIKRITPMRPGCKAPKLTPPANPDWYKRFRQMAVLAGKRIRIKR